VYFKIGATYKDLKYNDLTSYDSLGDGYMAYFTRNEKSYVAGLDLAFGKKRKLLLLLSIQ